MERMSYTDNTVIATSMSRLLPNRAHGSQHCGAARPARRGDFPARQWTPGRPDELVETGLCQGVNERLDRRDLKAGRYGEIPEGQRNTSGNG